MRILVVEDDTQLREQLQQQLAKTGFCVAADGDGEDRLFAGLNYPLDAAIVDLGLPKIPGLKVIEEQRFRKRTFPVMILTGRGNWQDKVAGLDAGADEHLTKPVIFPEMFARLHAVTRRGSGWATPKSSMARTH